MLLNFSGSSAASLSLFFVRSKKSSRYNFSVAFFTSLANSFIFSISTASSSYSQGLSTVQLCFILFNKIRYLLISSLSKDLSCASKDSLRSSVLVSRERNIGFIPSIVGNINGKFSRYSEYARSILSMAPMI